MVLEGRGVMRSALGEMKGKRQGMRIKQYTGQDKDG